MRFPADAPVTREKLEALKARLLRLGIELTAVEEQAVKGTGPGGQKVNKTQSGVLLRYSLGERRLIIKWTRERQHALNRFLALRELCDEVEAIVSPETSARLEAFAKLRKQKDRLRRRSQAARDAGPESDSKPERGSDPDSTSEPE